MTVAIGILVVLFIGAFYLLTKNAQFDPKIQAIAKAIAKAEGFGIPGAIPTVSHNPGNLKLGDTGNGTNQGKTIFPDDATGWQALYHQVGLMISGQSDYYGPGDTWRDIAGTWVGTPDANNWMLTVTRELSVGPDSTLGDYYGG
jgi:hypothetical protein